MSWKLRNIFRKLSSIFWIFKLSFSHYAKTPFFYSGGFGKIWKTWSFFMLHNIQQYFFQKVILWIVLIFIDYHFCVINIVLILDEGNHIKRGFIINGKIQIWSVKASFDSSLLSSFVSSILVEEEFLVNEIDELKESFGWC